MFKTRTIGDRFNKTATIVTAASGTWSYAITQGDLPIWGNYEVLVEISKSGVQESTLNQTEFQIMDGPLV